MTTGARRGLTRTGIIRTALELGFPAITMSDVAARLQVTKPALYRHVSNRRDLVLAAIDALFADAPQPSQDLPWRQLLRDEAVIRYHLERAHPGMLAAWDEAGGWPEAEVHRIHQLVLALASQGFSTESAYIATHSVVQVAHGEARQNTELAMFDGAPADTSFLDAYPAELAEIIAGLGSDPEGFLHRRLDLVIAGIAGELAPHEG